MTVSATQILAQLDQASHAFRFPAFGGTIHFIDARLHGYADRDRWAIVIEELNYHPGSGDLDVFLHVYGNCLDQEPGIVPRSVVRTLDDGTSAVEDPRRPGYVRPDLTELRIRGRTIPVAPSAGMGLVDFFRTLVPAHRDLLLASEPELRQVVPADLPEIITIEAWHHPDLPGLEPPGTQEAFCQLAEVLATRDPGRYRPTLEPNTHWRFWPQD
jgi:hypothetical protein